MAERAADRADDEQDEPKVPESPKALAFTIDFNEGKSVDTQRYKHLVQKYHNRHKRGQSLSKLEEAARPADRPPDRKAPLSGNLPRKASFHSEGYFSSDEKVDKFKANGARSSVLNSVIMRGDLLSLPLRGAPPDRMTQSFPNRNFDLPSINSPEVELKDVSSPELELVSPLSPLGKPHSSPDSEAKTSETSLDEAADKDFKSATDFDFDKSDAVSDAGTYTLDADNYTEEQKVRMSIDREFNIEQVSAVAKSREYVRSLCDVPAAAPEPVVEPVAERPVVEPAPEAPKAGCRVLYPSARPWGSVDPAPARSGDKGCFTSISTTGVLSKRPEWRPHARPSSLVQSEILVEAYTGAGAAETTQIVHATYTLPKAAPAPPDSPPSKIPSPKRVGPRARRRPLSADLSDSSNDTESYLKQSEHIISSLQARLSLDSEPDSDCERRCVPLNNETQALAKARAAHVRHNSLDDRNLRLPNKLEHFHSKNLHGMEHALKACNQYQYAQAQAQAHAHRIQNSPNDSPIRRSSSFSVKNQLEGHGRKESNLGRAPPPTAMQRSASTASMQPAAETESSSEDEYGRPAAKPAKDLTSTRYNRAFSLRRARLDVDPRPPKCPNTPEMKRKFLPERGTSVDRKPARPEIPSRYMNIAKPKAAPPQPPPRPEPLRAPPPARPAARPASSKPPVFSRTDSGRFSTRNTKSANPTSKLSRRDLDKKQSGPRSNSTLSSREVDFQNWKRRKSYDPMKAAAEGKRKAELARKQTQNTMTQSYNEGGQDYDSSPSHSSSVHRSQSFHGTAALGQLISSEDEDLTFSGDEGFSPPTPSPYRLSPTRPAQRQAWRDGLAAKR